MKWKILLGLVLLGVVGGLGYVWQNFGKVIRSVMVPSGSFDAVPPPAAPDYAAPGYWSALPERADAADAKVPSPTLPTIDQAGAPADVFYIHPTSYVGGKWTGHVGDLTLNENTDRVATRIQASAFNACCAIYAPRYRQANGMAFVDSSESSQRAIELAYTDVAAAFRSFLSRTPPGRPFILATHSQGTVHGYRLLKEEIAGKPVRSRLVVAYLIGGAITTDAVAKELPGIPVCGSREQTGCLVAFNARGPHYVPSELEMRIPGGLPREKLVCVNPLTWTADDKMGEKSQHLGALFLDSESPRVIPDFASAVCKNGSLVVSELGNVPRDFLSTILDRALGPENYHAFEYQLFFMNLRENAKTRLAAFGQHKPPAAAP